VNTDTLTADVTVGCLGKLCPIPVVETSKAVRKLDAGQTLLLIADDLGSDPDLHAWCDETGNELLRMGQEGRVFRFWIRCAGCAG
jgi:tRNA 2-thiouridine synthesizing protein A